MRAFQPASSTVKAAGKELIMAIVDIHLGPPFVWIHIGGVRNEGIHVVAARNHGKSRLLGTYLTPCDYRFNVPTIVFDDARHTIENAMHQLSTEERTDWSRIRYINMAGHNGKIVPFPLFSTTTDRPFVVAARFIELIERLVPELRQAPVTGLPMLTKIARNAGAILATLGYQITEMEDLLVNTKAWTERFALAVKIDPTIAPAVKFFKTKGAGGYTASKAETLINQLYLFSMDPTYRAIIGGTGGIDWADVISGAMLVFLDFKDITDEAFKRFLMLSVFRNLISFLSNRSDTTMPVSIIIDEFATLIPLLTPEGERLWVDDLNTLLQKTMRHANLWLTIGHQEITKAQLPESIQDLLMGMGTQIVGRADGINTALRLARELFPIDPLKVKRYREQIKPELREADGSFINVGYSHWSPLRGRNNPPNYYEITDEPLEYNVLEQHYENAEYIRSLPKLTFLFKAPRNQQLYRFMVDQFNPSYPDPTLERLSRILMHEMHARPIADVTREIESRLNTQPGSQPSTLPKTLPVKRRKE